MMLAECLFYSYLLTALVRAISKLNVALANLALPPNGLTHWSLPSLFYLAVSCFTNLIQKFYEPQSI